MAQRKKRQEFFVDRNTRWRQMNISRSELLRRFTNSEIVMLSNGGTNLDAVELMRRNERKGDSSIPANADIKAQRGERLLPISAIEAQAAGMLGTKDAGAILWPHFASSQHYIGYLCSGGVVPGVRWLNNGCGKHGCNMIPCESIEYMEPYAHLYLDLARHFGTTRARKYYKPSANPRSSCLLYTITKDELNTMTNAELAQKYSSKTSTTSSIRSKKRASDPTVLSEKDVLRAREQTEAQSNPLEAVPRDIFDEAADAPTTETRSAEPAPAAQTVAPVASGILDTFDDKDRDALRFMAMLAGTTVDEWVRETATREARRVIDETRRNMACHADSTKSS